MPARINLYSDTQTQPTPPMREAMARAPVGDEQRNEDPTVIALCERVAALLGKQAALFLPSGAMCNLIAVKTHTQPGDAVIAERECHIIRAECGGIGLVSGCVLDPLDTPDDHVGGTFTAHQVRRRVEHLSLGVYAPPPRLVCVEQTHNFAGGTIWPQSQLRDVAHASHLAGLATHMDGARLLNASVATGIPAAGLAEAFDSVWIDFSKGLGAPVGAALAGSRDFINRARRYKHMFGGAMRQAGIIAAGALYALDHQLERLAEDHANALRLAGALAETPGIALVSGLPQTNIVFFEVNRPGLDASAFTTACRARGLDLSLLHGRIRAVTHLDVSTPDIDRAISIVRDVLS
jgi:threonine aldolase